MGKSDGLAQLHLVAEWLQAAVSGVSSQLNGWPLQSQMWLPNLRLSAERLPLAQDSASVEYENEQSRPIFLHSSCRQSGPISLSSCPQEHSFGHPLPEAGTQAYTVCWRQCSPSWTDGLPLF